MHKLYTFPSGLRLLVKKVDAVRSVTAGIWVGTGSCNETAENNGISHFIEHMLFKGTKKRSALQIAEAVDNVGAQINAFTTKECTCFYTKSISEHVERCFEVLSDLFFNSVFAGDEMSREKKVVLEEISMVEDAPEDVCHELLSDIFFEGSTLGYRILGSSENVKGFTESDIRKYLAANYRAQNVVLSVVGNVDFSAVKELTKRYFDGNFDTAKVVLPDKPAAHVPSRKLISKKKQIEQASIAIGIPSISFNHPRSYPLAILNNILGGGGMSSRLFQKIREELGLAYSVYSYNSSYVNNGMFSVYCGTNPKNAAKVVETLSSELRRLKREYITESEFSRGKEQMKAAFILGQESTSSIMNVYGKLLVLSGEVFDIDKRLEAINGVTFGDIHDIIDDVISFDNVCAAFVSDDTGADLLQYLHL
ncbi:MAG: insulinase family protein [Clostridiales bacterium]|jgi:predicted Zn-dependent peptidase|nr:insulinase family protein [Clostridiales bacterium]